MSKLFVVVVQHHDPNIYPIKPICVKGPVHKCNCQQLYDLKKSKGEIEDPVNLFSYANLPSVN